MIKRMTKATSMLVAAAAVVSLIPATGASAATKTLETKEGTIEQAIAFDGGNYIFDGYKSSDDETGVYFNNGDKDKLVEDIDNADSVEAYGTKYAKVVDGNDEYLVDLSTGKIVEDETSEDIKDTLTSKLRSTLNKTDRYGQIASTSDLDLTEITEKQFGQTWYEYAATTSGGAVLNGYVNDAGKYIDTDYVANVSVLKDNKLVKIDNFGEVDSTSKIKVDLASAKTIAEDADYIYRVATVNITFDGVAQPQKTYLQKISKAQGETEDEAYLPKSVASYEITAAFDSEDADDAATSLADLSQYDFRVINGVVYATNNDGSKVTVKTFKLKKDKVAVDGGTTAKLDAYLVEQDVNEDQDVMGTNAVSIDVDGNTWALNKGTIYKFDGSDFVAVYSVDRAFDTLEVYNADSLLAWEDGEDAYATVAKATTTPVDQTPVVNKGWVNTASGWTFYTSAGAQVKGQWVNDGGVWYYIKADGVMATGWVKDGANWYFLNASGAMKTGWVKDGANWYFLNTSGAMATGWVQDGGNWYFLNASGAMLSNTTVNGYKLGASGAWVK
ncbi:N-acetylmuramoyl-L-alanine amidase family protein [Clostridium chromiireducens]|uniref:N-acetylmuramoyl-L-alanine amidase family protein n=1 Tax=Clostridium chromiireducens TaxID=225345 RepID=A0A399IUF0_9CLOT|nr:N-acetylmuramoyl-L-alanine amidase family protein [Clostridium chromiireducens]RII36644.1 N-acetylmuramoyl-L-alanine amidase family protein [Clostridium chromiireducens]